MSDSELSGGAAVGPVGSPQYPTMPLTIFHGLRRDALEATESFQAPVDSLFAAAQVKANRWCDPAERAASEAM